MAGAHSFWREQRTSIWGRGSVQTKTVSNTVYLLTCEDWFPPVLPLLVGSAYEEAAWAQPPAGTGLFRKAQPASPCEVLLETALVHGRPLLSNSGMVTCSTEKHATQRNVNIVWMWPIWVSLRLAHGSERWRGVLLMEIILPYSRLSSWSRERILIAWAQELTEKKTLKPNPFSVQNWFFKWQSNCSFNLFFVLYSLTAVGIQEGVKCCRDQGVKSGL